MLSDISLNIWLYGSFTISIHQIFQIKMAIWIFFQVLREQICQALADLQAKPKDDSLLLEAADLVKLATRDFKVWKGGLDAAYSKFLATYSTSFSDAILSIL